MPAEQELRPKPGQPVRVDFADEGPDWKLVIERRGGRIMVVASEPLEDNRG